MSDQPRTRTAARKRRRWFLGLERFSEAGRKGKRTQTWDVEDELIAVALSVMGDHRPVTGQKRAREIAIDAYAILRDVDVVVAAGTHVE